MSGGYVDGADGGNGEMKDVSGGGRGGGASRMLAVRNIPPEHNSITHLNAHFARFGNLQNIQVPTYLTIDYNIWSQVLNMV